MLSCFWLLANCCIQTKVYTAALIILHYATCQSKTLTKHGIASIYAHITYRLCTQRRLLVEYQGTISVIGKTNCRRENLKPSFNIRVIYLSTQSHLTGAAFSAFVSATHPAKLDERCDSPLIFYRSVVLFSVIIRPDYEKKINIEDFCLLPHPLMVLK